VRLRETGAAFLAFKKIVFMFWLSRRGGLSFPRFLLCGTKSVMDRLPFIVDCIYPRYFIGKERING